MEKPDEFDPGTYYTAYKPIRNALRKVSPISVMERCVRYLYEPVPDQMSQIAKQPWCVLLLIRWAFIDEQANHSAPAITHKRAIELLNWTLALQDKTRLPSDHDHVYLFMRQIAYQQFLYQTQFAISGLARQKILFAGVQENHYYKTRFRQDTNLEIQAFLELAIMTNAYFSERKKMVIDESVFGPLNGLYPSNVVQDFLKCISTPIAKLSEWLRSTDSLGRSVYEYYDPTQFLFRPLVQIGRNFVCLDPSVLQAGLEHFIYDRLRLQDAQGFMTHFGRGFEKYLGTLLLKTGLSIADEEQLLGLLPKGSKVVDFLVADDDTNVFIDAKAVEMATRGRLAYSSEVLRNRVDALTKAISQAHAVLSALPESGEPATVVRRRSNNFLLVVTLKPLYIGNGQSLELGIGREKMAALLDPYEIQNRIPVENMYFLTIDQAEVFLQMVCDGDLGMAEGLNKAATADAEPKTRKFDFALHLREWGAVKHNSTIKEVQESMLDGLREHLIAANPALQDVK